MALTATVKIHPLVQLTSVKRLVPSNEAEGPLTHTHIGGGAKVGTTYLPASGAAACEVCAHGTSSGVSGATSPRGCSSGRCGAGFYYSPSGRGNCLECPAGAYSADDADACAPCAAGYHHHLPRGRLPGLRRGLLPGEPRGGGLRRGGRRGRPAR